MDVPISLRLANKQDIPAILEVSKGIYGGKDYLPFEINQWFQSKAKYMFVAEVQGNVIGFQAVSIVDGGQTIDCQALRIHQKYRGRGYSYQIMAGVIDFVLGTKRGMSKVRHVIEQNNVPMKRLSDKMGCKAIMERRVSRLEDVPRKSSVVFKALLSCNNGELHELGLQDAVEFILDQKKFGLVFPEKRVMVGRQAYELMPENAEFVFKVGDKIFTDLNQDEMRRDLIPKSLSHGRRVTRIKCQIWVCHIFTAHRDGFKFHLIRQMLAAIDNLEQDADKREVQVLYPANLEFDAREIFKEVLCLEQDGIITEGASTLVYEKDI